MDTYLPIGERIALYRSRRGLSQSALAGLVGRHPDWLQKVEKGKYNLNQVATLYQIAHVLRVPLVDLVGDRRQAPSQDVPLDGVDTLRATLTNYEFLYATQRYEVRGLDAIRQDVARAWDVRYAAHYRDAAEHTAALLIEAELAAGRLGGDEQIAAWAVLADIYNLAVAILRKVPDHELAHLAADRAMWAAYRSGDPVMTAWAEASLTDMFLSAGQPDRAIDLATAAADRVRDRLREQEYATDRPVVLGALLLPAAISAARQADDSGARELLADAAAASRTLTPGTKDHRKWFVPGNVAMHRVHTAVELGQVSEALDLHNEVPIDTMPAERQGRYLIDVARVYLQRRNLEGVLLHLLDAERVAPEDVRTSPLVKHITMESLRRQAGKPHYRLARLAERVGVA